MSMGRTAVAGLAAAVAFGGVGVALGEALDHDDRERPVDPIELRKDDARAELVGEDDDRGDGDDTRGDDGTRGGDNTGDGDPTRGDDGTRGGDNTGDGDATRGDDGTGGGDNSFVASPPTPAPTPAPAPAPAYGDDSGYGGGDT